MNREDEIIILLKQILLKLSSNSHLFDPLLTGLATLVAAFLGAWFAFKFQRDKEKELEINRNVMNGNSAIFNIMRMITTLRNVQTQIIDPTRNRHDRFLVMLPTNNFNADEIKLNIDSLYFLLETDERNILGEVVIEETRFRSALQSINDRSRIHLKDAQPLLEKAGIVEGGDYTLEDIKKALGERLCRTLQRATEEMISSVDETIVSMKTVADKLKTSLKKIYPDKKIIGFEIIK